MGNKQIGHRIETRRKQLGLTLDDIASEVGVAKSTIQRYEKGTIEKIKLPVIEAIARVLSVDPAWICCKSENMFLTKTTTTTGSDLTEEALAIGKAYMKATPKEQHTVRIVLYDYLQEDMAPKSVAARNGIDLEQEDWNKVILPNDADDTPV